MPENKKAESGCNRIQPKSTPRKGSAATEIASTTQSVKREHLRPGPTARKLYRCLTTGKVAPASEHVRDIVAEFTRADPRTVDKSIRDRGTFYGRKFEEVTDERG